MYNEIEKAYEERMNRLTNEELIILQLILELSESVRQKSYAASDTNLFMRAIKNIGNVELENEETGETVKIRSKSIKKSFKKFQKMRLLKVDSDGLPLFFPDAIPQLSF